MCGITGFIDNHTLNLDYSESLLKRMISTLSHRGPDDSGYWINDQKKIFLGHSRLSIIDLSCIKPVAFL